jgi:hypothetical protein
MVAEFFFQQFFQDNKHPVFGYPVYQLKYTGDDRVFSGDRIRRRHWFTPDKIQQSAEFYFFSFFDRFFFIRAVMVEATFNNLSCYIGRRIP